MHNSNNVGSNLGAILLGAVIGGALGILFAPAEGAKTRRRIAANKDNIAEAVTEKYNQFVDFVEAVKKDVETIKQKADDLYEAEKIKMS